MTLPLLMVARFISDLIPIWLYAACGLLDIFRLSHAYRSPSSHVYTWTRIHGQRAKIVMNLIQHNHVRCIIKVSMVEILNA